MKIMDVRRKIHNQGQDDGDYQPYKTWEPTTGDKFYGLMNVDGGFIIIKASEGLETYETIYTFYYGKGGTTSFNTAWTNKASLTYIPIYDLL